MRRSVVCLLACGVLATAAKGSVSGFIDTSYSLNLNKPPGATATSQMRLYDDRINTWLLNAAHVAITGGLGRDTEYVVELDLGYDASRNPGSTGNFDIQEAYVDAKIGDSGLGLRAGKFATSAGIEVMESPENPTISRGFLYTYAQPRTHTGGGLAFAGDQFDVALNFVNGWDLMVDDNNTQTYVLELGVEPNEDFGLTLTYVTGTMHVFEIPPWAWFDRMRTSLDLTASIAAGPSTRVYVQYNTASQETGAADVKWSGVGVQAVIEPSRDFSLGLRYEIFEDPDDWRVNDGAAASYSNITVAPGFKLSDSTRLRFELRIDTADGTVFQDDTGAYTRDTQTTVALELYTTF